VTTLVFAGCNFPNCPRASIYEASERDFHIVLASDAISGFYERGAAELTNIGVTLEAARDIVSSLHRHGDRGARLQRSSLAATDANA
jgi:nicotinamidase-related amidase